MYRCLFKIALLQLVALHLCSFIQITALRESFVPLFTYTLCCVFASSLPLHLILPMDMWKGSVTIEIILIDSKIYFILSIVLFSSFKYRLLKQTKNIWMGKSFTISEMKIWFGPGNLDCFNSCFCFFLSAGENQSGNTPIKY